MQAQLVLSALMILIVGTIKSGEALSCWTCSSSSSGNCGDFFNTTRLRQTYSPEPVHMLNCDNHALSDQKFACMKKITTHGNIKMVNRQCMAIQNPYSKETTCPGPDSGTEFCEFCYTDGCNGAATIRTTVAILAVFIPVLFHLTK